MSRVRLIVPKLRMVIAENHLAMLAQLCQVMGDEYEIVRTADNGFEACDAVLDLQPDVVVMDISMPGLDGLLATQRLRREKCRAKIILLSDYDDPDFIAAAFSSGADCYVAKARLSMDLEPAIRIALQGSHFISKSDGITELSSASRER